MTPELQSHADYILTTTFVNEDLRLGNKMSELIRQNAELGNPPEGFLFGGTFWSHYPKKQHMSLTRRIIHPDLTKEATTFLAEHKGMEKDKVSLKQRLTQLLRDCRSNQDIRDALPEVALPYMPPELQSLPRVKDQGWPFKSRPILMEDFKRTADIFLFYTANRMLY